MNQRILLIASLCAIIHSGFSQKEQSTTGIEQVVNHYYLALRESDEQAIRRYVAPVTTVVSLDGNENSSDGSHLKDICAWERALHQDSYFKILNVNGNKATVLLRENNDFYHLLGLESMTEITDCIVVDGKISRFVQKIFLHERNQQGKQFQQFRQWLLSQPGLDEPNLVTKEKTFLFNGESAPRMVYWLKRWQTQQTSETHKDSIARSVVVAFCEALKELNVAKAEKYLDPEFRLMDTQRNERLYNPLNAQALAAWDKEVNTRISYEVIETGMDAVKVVFFIKSNYDDLIGAGERTEVAEFRLRNGKIYKRTELLDPVHRLLPLQNAYFDFNLWLLEQSIKATDLLSKDHKLILSAKNAAQIIAWLKKWEHVAR